MADAVGQAEVGKEGKGPAGMTCLVYIMQNIAKQDPGRARQYYQGTAGTNFSNPRTRHFGVLSRSLKEFVCIYYRKNAANQRKRETSRTACNPPQNIIIVACLNQITQVLPLMSEIGAPGGRG